MTTLSVCYGLSRNQIHLFSLDNPEANKASVQRLVGLPDGQALYRARWTIWSGWHLMWGVEQFSGQERLVLRTAAICDDMVLSPPDLVPSVVRAGLLHDEFYPTKPARNKDKVGRTDYPNAKERRSFVRRARKDDDRQKDRDDVNRDVSNSRRRGAASLGNALAIKERVDNPTVTSSDVNRLAGADMEDRGLSMTFDKRGDLTKRPLEVSVSDSGLSSWDCPDPFEEMSLDNGVTVIVLDADEPSPIHLLRDVVGHTPYLKHKQYMGFNQRLDFAAWSLISLTKGQKHTGGPVRPKLHPTRQLCCGCCGSSIQACQNNRCDFCWRPWDVSSVKRHLHLRFFCQSGFFGIRGPLCRW